MRRREKFRAGPGLSHVAQDHVDDGVGRKVLEFLVSIGWEPLDCGWKRRPGVSEMNQRRFMALPD